jgi:hypothetical protein
MTQLLTALLAHVPSGLLFKTSNSQASVSSTGHMLSETAHAVNTQLLRILEQGPSQLEDYSSTAPWLGESGIRSHIEVSSLMLMDLWPDVVPVPGHQQTLSTTSNLNARPTFSFTMVRFVITPWKFAELLSMVWSRERLLILNSESQNSMMPWWLS